MLRIACDLRTETSYFDLEPEWRAVEMEGLRIDLPPAGRLRTSILFGSKGSVPVPPSGHWPRTIRIS